MRSLSCGTQALEQAPPLSASSASSSSSSGDENSSASGSISAMEANTQTDTEGPCSVGLRSPPSGADTWTSIPPGDLGGLPGLVRSAPPSMSQRVQVNRAILQQLLNTQAARQESSQSESREQPGTGFVPNNSDFEILLQDGNDERLFVSARLPRQQQCEDRVRMKRRCVPLRADHNLLTPGTHTLSGVRLCPATLSAHLRDSSISEPAVRLTRQRPAASPPRRLRFEDETEKEAESRYQERQRQRRWAKQQVPDVLVSKPDLNLYVSGRAGAGLLEAGGAVADRQQRGAGALKMAGVTAAQCDSCGVVAGGGGPNPRLQPTPPASDNRGRSQYRLNVRTEPIKETYIGSVTPPSSNGSVRGARPSNMQVRRRTHQVEVNGNQGLLKTTPTTELPINPYALDRLATPSTEHPQGTRPKSAAHNGTRADPPQNQSQEEKGKPEAAKPQRAPPSGPKTQDRSGGPEPRAEDASRSEAQNQTLATPDSSGEGQVRKTKGAEHQDDTAVTTQFSSRDKSSRLSLRSLFSNVTLSRARTGSLDRLTSRPRPPTPDPTHPGPRRSPCLLKKSPSVQSLNQKSASVQMLSMGSPFLKLRKSLSVQNFVSEQKKDRSADYRPAAHCLLQRCLSVEDVGQPRSMRSVGRVLQVCPDGTFLLELNRPKGQGYGFIISRGRGRPDSGVYVEDMVDSSTEKLYAGLLAVGDEILEVNGEKVACLSLDQVTQMLTQNTSTTVQILRHWRRPQ